jgi:hypothetical protein
MAETMTYVEIARRVIEKRSAEQAGSASQPATDTQQATLEESLRDRAIELWSTAAGRLFLVADETDARLAVERLGARRGEIYTAAEARRIVAVKDPSVVAEIHDWKRRFDGVVREFRAGERPK